MTGLLLQFLPFFALVLVGWAAARSGLLPLDGLGALNTFVLFFAMPAMLLRLGASGALGQGGGLGGLLLVYGLAGLLVVGLALAWAQARGLSRLDGGLLALATAFPNTGFLGLPLLTGLLGPQAAGPLAATLLVDVLLLSSLCLAWAHTRAAQAPRHGVAPVAGGRDQAEAWQAVRASLHGALRNPLLWSVAVGMAVAQAGWSLPRAADETLRLLGLSATPAALFTLGGIVARAQLRPGGGVRAERAVGRPLRLTWLAVCKLLLHPLAVWGLGALMAWAGHALPPAGWLTLTLAAALPSASNVSMLAEREGAHTASVARLILWTTVGALLTLTLWAHVLGVQAAA